THRLALVKAATSGNRKFFLGTDSAPHSKNKKENACGCAGIFSAPLAIELYARAFDENNALDQLETFASFNGADFYGLPRNTTKIILEKKTWTVPDTYPFGEETIVPIHAGETETWQLLT
ncbi:MAG TPA: dihydroorotase, partial [Gammaproteobacteria bacterium]